jgi:acid phosphatase (class A)
MKILKINKYLAPIALCFLAGACATINSAHNVVSGTINQSIGAPTQWQTILQPPPSAQSPQAIADYAQVKEAQLNANEARINLARSDNNIDAFKAYSIILGDRFNPQNFPKTKEVLDYAMPFSAIAAKESKNIYKRDRPFIFDTSIKICIDNAPNGSSYPSGHSAWGWLSGNIIARIFPKQSDIIFARAIDYGQSRVVCGVHYPTDIIAGRIVGDVILQKLENDAKFRQLINAAIEEAAKQPF